MNLLVGRTYVVQNKLEGCPSKSTKILILEESRDPQFMRSKGFDYTPKKIIYRYQEGGMTTSWLSNDSRLSDCLELCKTQFIETYEIY